MTTINFLTEFRESFREFLSNVDVKSKLGSTI